MQNKINKIDISDKIVTVSVTDVISERIDDISKQITKNKQEHLELIDTVKFGLNSKIDDVQKDSFESLSKLDLAIAEIQAQIAVLVQLQGLYNQKVRFGKLKKFFKCKNGKNHSFKREIEHKYFITVHRCEHCGELVIE